jgi:hypothetical protein
VIGQIMRGVVGVEEGRAGKEASQTLAKSRFARGNPAGKSNGCHR